MNAILHGAHTDFKYYMYVDAPINDSDEAPLALWISDNPEGPWIFDRYVLDGGLSNTTVWDKGRYSGGSVVYSNGLFHLMISASTNPTSKAYEQIGWATSIDGKLFVPQAFNPVAGVQFVDPIRSAAASLTTPQTDALAEASIFIDDDVSGASNQSLIYAHHTIRWDSWKKTSFAPFGRNREDIGVEIFSMSPVFSFSMPMITSLWNLTLTAGETSPCLYDNQNYRYCVALKTAIHSSAVHDKELHPSMTFEVSAELLDVENGNAAATLQIFEFSSEGLIGDLLMKRPLYFQRDTAGHVVAKETLFVSASPFIVATIQNHGDTLTKVRQSVRYRSDGVLHGR